MKVHNHFPPLGEKARDELFEAPVVVPLVLLTDLGRQNLVRPVEPGEVTARGLALLTSVHFPGVLAPTDNLGDEFPCASTWPNGSSFA